MDNVKWIILHLEPYVLYVLDVKIVLIKWIFKLIIKQFYFLNSKGLHELLLSLFWKCKPLIILAENAGANIFLIT